MRESLVDRLGMSSRIFGFSHSREVVAAISAAGGFGVLGTVRTTPEKFRADLEWVSANNGGRAFGVDIVYPASSAGDDTAQLDHEIPAAHREFVAGLQERFGVPDATDPDRSDLYSAHTITMANAVAFTEITLEFDVRLVVAALGAPPQGLIDRIHAKGALVGGLVGSPRHATRQVAAGVDVIVAQGSEAGGHVGSLSTMVLTPQVVDAVPGVPVLAAGGIADGRQMLAAEALGAEGVWLGSIWLTTHESISPRSIKRRLLTATSEDTTVTKAFSGKTVRLLQTPWLQAWDAPDAPQPLKAPMQGLLIRNSINSIVENDVDGLVTSPIGQVVGFMNEELSVAEVVARLRQQYDEARARRAAADWSTGVSAP